VDTRKMETGRNDPCPCGSGKKYKNCHLDKDEAVAREARAKEAAAAAPPPAEAETTAPTTGAVPPRARGHGHTSQPWKRGTASTRGFQRMSTPRKVGSG
jgi:hypothetical protein